MASLSCWYAILVVCPLFHKPLAGHPYRTGWLWLRSEGESREVMARGTKPGRWQKKAVFLWSVAEPR